MDKGEKLLHLILADSELETVPSEISSDKSIQRRAQKREKRATELILDSNYYHKPMRQLEDSERRGRPDIVQICILTALDSPLNREGLLRLYVHTRQDKIIDIDPETRIPRSYNRFIGLMEQLFLTDGVPPDDPLMELQEMTLAEKLEDIDAKRTLGLSREGRKIGRDEIFRGLEKKDDLCVIIGGFPRGDFLSDVEGFSDDMISIYPESLDAVTPLTHFIQFYEEEYIPELILSEE